MHSASEGAGVSSWSRSPATPQDAGASSREKGALTGTPRGAGPYFSDTPMVFKIQDFSIFKSCHLIEKQVNKPKTILQTTKAIPTQCPYVLASIYDATSSF